MLDEDWEAGHDVTMWRGLEEPEMGIHVRVVGKGGSGAQCL